jgi:hypothetical protein
LKGATKCPQDEDEGSCMLSSEENRLQLGLKHHDKGSGLRDCIEHTFRIVKKNNKVNPKHLQVGIILRIEVSKCFKL